MLLISFSWLSGQIYNFILECNNVILTLFQNLSLNFLAKVAFSFAETKAYFFILQALVYIFCSVFSSDIQVLASREKKYLAKESGRSSQVLWKEEHREAICQQLHLPLSICFDEIQVLNLTCCLVPMNLSSDLITIDCPGYHKHISRFRFPTGQLFSEQQSLTVDLPVTYEFVSHSSQVVIVPYRCYNLDCLVIGSLVFRDSLRIKETAQFRVAYPSKTLL